MIVTMAMSVTVTVTTYLLASRSYRVITQPDVGQWTCNKERHEETFLWMVVETSR